MFYLVEIDARFGIFATRDAAESAVIEFARNGDVATNYVDAVRKLGNRVNIIIIKPNRFYDQGYNGITPVGT